MNKLTAPSILRLLLWLGLSFAMATLGSAATTPNLVPWYANLGKPSFNPPNFIFPIVWTTLFVMMAVAIWRVLESDATKELKRRAILWHICQLILNVSWSVVFFALHQLGGAVVVLILLWLAIAITMRTFLAADKVAGWLMAPYLAWVSFAGVLNTTIWLIN